jgi:hypothetical protein
MYGSLARHGDTPSSSLRELVYAGRSPHHTLVIANKRYFRVLRERRTERIACVTSC